MKVIGAGDIGRLNVEDTVLDTDSVPVLRGNYLFKSPASAIAKNISAVTSVTSSQAIDETSYQWNGKTDGGAITFTLPAGTQSATFKMVNTGTSGNALTVSPSGAELLIGVNSNFTLLDGESLIIAYDTTDGWY